MNLPFNKGRRRSRKYGRHNPPTCNDLEGLQANGLVRFDTPTGTTCLQKTPRLEGLPDSAMQSTVLPSLACGKDNLPRKYVREGVTRTIETPGSCICSSMEPKRAAAGYAAVDQTALLRMQRVNFQGRVCPQENRAVHQKTLTRIGLE